MRGIVVGRMIRRNSFDSEVWLQYSQGDQILLNEIANPIYSLPPEGSEALVTLYGNIQADNDQHPAVLQMLPFLIKKGECLQPTLNLDGEDPQWVSSILQAELAHMGVPSTVGGVSE